MEQNHALENALCHLETINELIVALTEAAAFDTAEYDGETLTRDDLIDRITEYPLDVSVRSDWYHLGDTPEPAEYMILLSAGGPALRITGDLDKYNEPASARLEYQDWGTPWTPVKLDDDNEETLMYFAQQFYYA